MRKIVKVAVFVFCLITTSSYAQNQLTSNLSNPQELAKVGVLKFDTMTIDYGTIKQNANGVREFKFKNTGNAPIIITKVKASCGCTVPTKPAKAIMPGETASIQVKYATNRLGAFSKTITVSSNAKEKQLVLHIKGKVIL